MGNRFRTPEERIIQLLMGRHLVEPPASTLHKARALATHLPQPALGLVRWVVERLFDSAQVLQPAGVRGGSSAERRLLLQLGATDAPEGQLDLLIRREAGGTLALQGQLVPVVAGAEIEVGSGRSRQRMTLNEVGDFYLRGVVPSAQGLAIVLHVPGVEPLQIGDLDLPTSDRA
ncbi:MAG: hypothetical protein U0V87_07850 [Acidobacteriota bacterium]